MSRQRMLETFPFGFLICFDYDFNIIKFSKLNNIPETLEHWPGADYKNNDFLWLIYLMVKKNVIYAKSGTYLPENNL